MGEELALVAGTTIFFIVILSPAKAGREDLRQINIIANPAEILRRVQKSNAPQDDMFGCLLARLETRPTISELTCHRKGRGAGE